MSMKEELIEKIQNKTLTMGVCALGYVGLPLAVDKAKHGFRTIGFDVQQEKVDMVNAGKNYIGDVVNEDLEALVKAGQLPAYKISPKITRFDRADVEEYLASRYVKAKALQRKTRVRRPNEFRGGVNNSGYYPGMKVV